MKINKKGKVYIVVGGQWGSEAKGLFCQHLAQTAGITMSARTGSINAGHTVYHEGKAYKNQQIPVAWINPNVKLIIGAGAYVHTAVLRHEIEMIEKATGKSLKDRLFIDWRAGVHDDSHKQQSVGRHERFGTVGEGVSAAICNRIRRDMGVELFRDRRSTLGDLPDHFTFADTVSMLNDEYDHHGQILIEGTQGTFLDVYLGDFPFTTSRQTIASTWLSECGLSPKVKTEIALICRTHPIRVAGNSGPMTGEMSWQILTDRINDRRRELGMLPIVSPEALRVFDETEARFAAEYGMPDHDFYKWTPELRAQFSKPLVEIHRRMFDVIPSEIRQDLFNLFETTTVTRKLRRIAELSIPDLEYSIKINRPDYIVLNFLNYVFPSLFTTDIDLSPEADQIETYVKELEAKIGTPIKYINWKPNQVHERITKKDGAKSN